MDAAQVKALLQAQLPECEIHVQGQGSNYDIEVVGEPVRASSTVFHAIQSLPVHIAA